MKYLPYFAFLFLISSCASHRSFNNNQVIEYASYQMNCSSNQLKILKQVDDFYTVSGCQKTQKFEKFCSLGPCYILKVE